MSGKGPSINAPKGGGALAGIGESFQPEIQTGTGNVSVPISVPAGRNGLQPSLILGYGSGSPNGPFGQGWSISVPGVSRKTSKGVPRYDDTDVFVVSGAEDLVAVDGAPAGRQRYRPRVEGVFARIEHVTGGGQDYWEIWSRDGLRSLYGTARPANASAGWQDPAAVVDPAVPGHVYGWQLSQTVDPSGNTISYGYQRDGNRLYLSDIRYVDHGDPAAPSYLVRIAFGYQARPDATTSYRSGFAIRMGLRCTSIQTFIDTGTPILSRTVTLDYTQAPGNGVSLLHTVQVTGNDGAATQSLPPLEFGYSTFDLGGRRYIDVGGAELPAAALNGPDTELVDLFGDGLPGVLEMDEQVRYWRNIGGGALALPHGVAAAPAGLRLSDSGVQLADMTGDGRADLLVTGRELAGYFPMSAEVGFGRFVPYPQAPPVNLEDSQVRLLDLTGDGVIDALRIGTWSAAFINDPDLGWTSALALPAVPPVSFTDPYVKLADMTGDGLTDLVYARNGVLRYWPSLGYGRFGAPIDMSGAPRFPDGQDFDPRRLLIGDVDGDGAADVAYVANGQITVWINQGGASLGSPVTVRGTPPVAGADSVRLADLLGNGTAGILWTYDEGTVRGSNFKFLDLTGGIKPYLLTRMDNHHGAVTSVEYAASTRFLLDDLAAGRPWATTLPFPVQVVARATVTDVLSGATHGTTYRYHHGYFDGPDREFRGFARVDVLDVFTLTGGPDVEVPTETRTWFHIGPVGSRTDAWTELDLASEYWTGDRGMLGPRLLDLPATLSRSDLRQAVRSLHGLVLRTELYGLDGDSQYAERPYTVSENRYRVRQVSAGIFYPHGIAARSTQWERGDDPMHQFSFTDGHDVYGRARFSGVIGVPRGQDPTTGTGPGERYLAGYSVVDYATRDDDRYMVDRTAATTRYELLDDGTSPVAALWANAVAGTAQTRLMGHTITCYDGAPFAGLPLGRLGDTGLVSRGEQLVHTPQTLAAAWGSTPPDMAAAGYVDRTGRAGYLPGWYRYTIRAQYGPGGQIIVDRNPLGHDTTITYDAYDLLPVKITDPIGLATSATYDYRLLEPSVVTDANGNRTATTFTPLGMPATIAVMGKPGEQAGDTPEVPGSVFSYALTAYDDAGQPIHVHTIRRAEHYWDLVRAGVTDFGPDEVTTHPERFLQVREFSDGFGRLLQSRAQGDDLVIDDLGLPCDVTVAPGAVAAQLQPPDQAPRVVVSGWQVYDAKNRVVERYEPYPDSGFDYFPAATKGQAFQKIVTSYDPRGEVIKTLHPDGSQEVFIRGVPLDITDPRSYRPTPWETYDYDVNDNAGRTHPAESQIYRDHWNTPESTLIDALGRVVMKTERLADHTVVTRVSHDIEGRVIAVTDPLGRTAGTSVYDLLGRPWLVDLIDHGPVRLVLDPLDGQLERLDAKGAVTRVEFDAVHRPVRLFAADHTGAQPTLRQVHQYGEAAGLPDALARNLAGRPYRDYDEAGLVTVSRYDLNGKAIETTRQVLRTDVLTPTYTVDWSAPEGLLDPITYQVDCSYDALGRRTSVTYPMDADGKRAVQTVEFGRAGHPVRVTLDGADYIERIAYNARGQRVLVLAGNGMLTRYAHDPITFLLARSRTEQVTVAGPLDWRIGGAVHQDHGYAHDLVGNITTLRDRTPGCGIPPGPADALDRTFTHDPLYRLVSATGRECAATPGQDPWIDIPRCTDATKTAQYAEAYAYDDVGNTLSLTHTGAATRVYTLTPGGNRLASMTWGKTTYGYTYDACGNQLTETASRHFTWDHADRLTAFANSVNLTNVYRCDAGGARVIKLRRNQGGGTALTIYIGDLFERLIITTPGGKAATCDTLHVMDEVHRIARVRAGAAPPGDRTPPVVYYVADHLESVAVTVDATGAFVDREEYTPYGETSFGGYATKRYRYTGKERDEDSGLYYCGARYYAPWLTRWISTDPAHAEHVNRAAYHPYCYADGRPASGNDPDGHLFQLAAAAVGFVAGGIVGGGIEVGRRLYRHEAVFSREGLKKIGVRALEGSIAGGVTGLTAGASLFAEAVAGGVGMVAAGATGRAIRGEKQTAAAVADDAATGVIGAAAGRVAGWAIKKGVGVAKELWQKAVRPASAASSKAVAAAHQELLQVVQKGGPTGGAKATAAFKVEIEGYQGPIISRARPGKGVPMGEQPVHHWAEVPESNFGYTGQVPERLAGDGTKYKSALWTNLVQNDAERKGLDNIANLLPANAKGTVWLMLDRASCPSCIQTIYEFTAKFRGVRLNVLYSFVDVAAHSQAGPSALIDGILRGAGAGARTSFSLFGSHQ
jgi:RHS repeat-associated protein